MSQSLPDSARCAARQCATCPFRDDPQALALLALRAVIKQAREELRS